MTLPDPFSYPTTPHVRRHGPQGYKDYGDYKLFLRDDFTFRCIYCLERERFYPNRHGSFSADHFVPKAIKPGLECDYDNLVYACVRCNSFKQTKITFLDPAKVTFSEHFHVRDDGHIVGVSAEARDLIDLMHLDEGPALEIRQHVLRVLKIKATFPEYPDVHATLLHYLSFPEDLPDLSFPRPPGGNTKPVGIQNSYYEQKKRNELPEMY